MTDAEIRTVAFLGLGHMGLPMAVNLREAGKAVRGYDPMPPADFDILSSPAEACAGADVVITMLPSGGHVLDVYPEIIGAVGPETILVDCSTIDIADARAAHELAAAAGLRSVDAPVSGGVVGATAATLTFMVGADTDVFDAVEPLLGLMGKRAVHCGDAGAGQAAKVCNNMILAASMIAVSEGFVLAESLGLDPRALFDVVSTSSGQCWAVNANCPVPGPVPTSPANRGFEGGFANKLMAKDLRLAASAADMGGVDAQLGRHALDIYEAMEATSPDLDFSSVIEAIRQHSTERDTQR